MTDSNPFDEAITRATRQARAASRRGEAARTQHDLDSSGVASIERELYMALARDIAAIRDDKLVAKGAGFILRPASQQTWLRAIMQQHHLTGGDVAKIIGVDPRSVRRWLQPDDQPGYREMPTTAITRLREALDR